MTEDTYAIRELAKRVDRLEDRVTELEAHNAKLSSTLKEHIDYWRNTQNDAHGIATSVMVALEAVKAAWEGKP